MTARRALHAAVLGRSSVPLTLAALLLCIGSCAESKEVDTGAAHTKSALAAASPTACGRTGLPDCPLQGWMKATLQPYLNAKDGARLAASLEQLAAKAPAGFDGWREAALEGAKAAHKGDLKGAKAQCKTCHDQHRNRFRAEQRTAVLF